MPLDAITYRVRPGHEDELTEVFSPHNFTRVDSPVIRDEAGETVGMLLGTGLFVQGDTLVRVIHHDGVSAARVARHMSVQKGVHEAERAILPYLAEPRDTETPEGFRRHFHRSLMTVLEQHSPDERPAAGTVALRLPLRPGAGAELAQARATANRKASLLLSDDHATIVRTALFLHVDALVRVIQYDGHPYDVVGYLTDRCFGQDADAWLEPYLENSRRPVHPDAYLTLVHEQAMLSIAHMSVLGVD
ncbi:SchA/CurD-like protein [Streptomyces spongiicola]|uniref:SchA/CurD-like protein n=1 Tax=Streptomyces spongiicola TaxID=1690221 RepID=A0A2S1YXM5_9ACTN|nr:SchA/CurD-like domain-containing protein [Streptomyces spongiicola]AWK08772.1 SchA/CurD-like protein [Streptomyces spongiicola]GBP99901.1 SchA/CurD-like protein [Streptomyces spongiicola]